MVVTDIREGHWTFTAGAAAAEADHKNGLPVLEQCSIHLEAGICSNGNFFFSVYS